MLVPYSIFEEVLKATPLEPFEYIYIYMPLQYGPTQQNHRVLHSGLHRPPLTHQRNYFKKQKRKLEEEDKRNNEESDNIR